MDAVAWLIILVFIGIPILVVLRETNAQSKTILNEVPLKDSKDNQMQNIWVFNITGVTHIREGVNPQKIIPRMQIGETVKLCTDPANPYDSQAIKVLTYDDKQIGWYPAKDKNKSDLFMRLESGQEVNAWIFNKGISAGRYWCELKIVVYKHSDTNHASQDEHSIEISTPEYKMQLDLVNYRELQMQEAIVKCSKGDKIEFQFDSSKDRYLAISKYGNIGYFSKSKNHLLKNWVSVDISFWEYATNEKGMHIPAVEVDYSAEVIDAKARNRR